MKQLVTLIWLCLFAFNAQAKLFQNAYISFELPSNWECDRKNTEWICHDKFADRKNRAVIILTAKEAGPSDNLQTYERHLKNPKFLADKSGKANRSQVFTVKQWKIAGQTWVDGLHYRSEVKSFYTRYLATVKSGLGILITFSAHKQHYTKYNNDFMKGIRSLKVIAKRGVLANKGSNGIGSAVGGAIVGRDLTVPQEILSESLPQESEAGEESPINLTTILLLLAVLAGLAGAYLLLKK